MKVGNKWFYSSWVSNYNPGGPTSYEFIGTRTLQIQKDTIINGKKYFHIINNLSTRFTSGIHENEFVRIDSTTSYYYKFDQNQNEDVIFFNPFSKVNDTTMNYYFLVEEDTITLFNTNTLRKKLLLFVPGYGALYWVKNFGIQYSVFNEFGGYIDSLKGYIINDTVYGDTSFVLDVEDKKNNYPESFTLFQNYPNPFNPVTTIDFIIPEKSFTELKVFDVLAREIKTLVASELEKVRHSVQFDGNKLPSGVYFYRIKAGRFIDQKKMVLQK